MTLYQVQSLCWQLAGVYMELLELKQRKFERTAGNLEPRLLQKMVGWCSVVGCTGGQSILVQFKTGHCKVVWYGAVQ